MGVLIDDFFGSDGGSTAARKRSTSRHPLGFQVAELLVWVDMSVLRLILPESTWTASILRD